MEIKYCRVEGVVFSIEDCRVEVLVPVEVDGDVAVVDTAASGTVNTIFY